MSKTRSHCGGDQSTEQQQETRDYHLLFQTLFCSDSVRPEGGGHVQFWGVSVDVRGGSGGKRKIEVGPESSKLSTG